MIFPGNLPIFRGTKKLREVAYAKREALMNKPSGLRNKCLAVTYFRMEEPHYHRR